MEHKLCHNDSDFLGDEFTEHSTLIYIISDNGKVIYCYTYDDIKGMTKEMNIFEWDTKNPKQKQVLKLPNENVWIDHVSIMLLKYFRTFILKKIRQQKIGSDFGVSNIHGEEYSLYRLLPFHRNLITKIYNKEIDVTELLKRKNEGTLLSTIDITSPSVIRFPFGIFVGDVIKKNKELFVNGKIYTDLGNIFKYKGNIDSLVYSITLDKEKISNKDTKVETINFKNGNIYEGEVLEIDNKFIANGDGTMKYTNGDNYTGEFKNNQRHGEGLMTYENGNIYEGNFKLNQRDGFGKMIEDRDVYTGMWKDDKKNGKGKMKYTNGKIYDGDWKENLKDGIGTMSYLGTEGKVIYEGEWRDDKRNGNGKITLSGNPLSNAVNYNNEYKGNWIDDELYVNINKNSKEGKGTYINSDNVVFDGIWSDNLLVKGDQIDDEGKFTGEWNSYGKTGEGKFKYLNGDVYSGNWDNNKKNGIGVILFKNGNGFQGDWKDNVITGKGVKKYTNGDAYIGMWKNFLKHGKGKMTYNDKTVYNGEWIKNKRIDNKKVILSDDEPEDEFDDDEELDEIEYDPNDEY